MITIKKLIPAILLALTACGQKTENAGTGSTADEPAITMNEGGTIGSIQTEETMSIEAEAPVVAAPHGGLLFPAGTATVELVLSANDQRIYLLDTRNQAMVLPDDCVKFTLLTDTGDVADFKRDQVGVFVTKDLPNAAIDGTSGRIYFASCPIEGVTSALVQISPDPQRLASNGGHIWYVAGILAEVLREGATLKLWVTSRDAVQGPGLKFRSVSLQKADGTVIKLAAGKGEGAYTAVVDDAAGSGKLLIGTTKETIGMEIEW